MTFRFAKTTIPLAVALALATLSACAMTQDVQDVGGSERWIETEPPGRVGRVSLIQGKVTISSEVGETASEALVNWPVTTDNLITTAPGARAELRVGSTSIRLDGDSSLAVTELDDDSLRLRLHYGSASIRILSDEVAPEFELATPQARVRMQRAGRLRVDAERTRDTSLVSVFDGEAQVDGAGANLTVRAGRSAEVQDYDVRTLQARRDAFDDWALGRDRLLDNAASARYVTTEMTGYEELDRHGSWSQDPEYGALWIPTVVSTWTPYQDGRWTWIAPWGWTWVDNAPWGYAPFHYGRWVQVRNRWAWAPGRHERRPIWAPALVGWVGGGGWNAHFHSRSQPALGWYPLGPHDRYVPHYRLSDDRLRRLNSYGWRTRDQKGPDRRPDYRPPGLTVVPHSHFGQRGPVVVSSLPKASKPALGGLGMASAPPPPAAWRDRLERNRSERERGEWSRERNEWNRDRAERDRDRDRDRDRFQRGQRPPLLATDPGPQNAAAPLAAPLPPGRITTAPAPLGAPVPNIRPPQAERPEQPRPWFRPERAEREERGNREWRGGRDGDEGPRSRPHPVAAMPAPMMQASPRPAPPSQAPMQLAAPRPSMPAPSPAPTAVAPPAPQAMPSAPSRPRMEHRGQDDAQERGFHSKR